MVLDRINKIKTNISIYTNKKTSNLLDGTYNSIYKGKSLNFEDLRDYVPGDNVKDIDWKASARNGSLLIKQFVAEKKHNVIILFDASKKMNGNTKDEVSKKEIQIQSLGTIGYLANKNGDYVAGLFSKDEFTYYSNFKSSLFSIEQILANYDSDKHENINSNNLIKSLDYIAKYINRKSILFIATDLYGLHSIPDQMLKTLSVNNNILIINVEDAELSGNNVFDIDDNKLVPKFLLNNKKLLDEDKRVKDLIKKDCDEKLKKYAISMVSISSEKEIVPKILELLEKHKYAK